MFFTLLEDAMRTSTERTGPLHECSSPERCIQCSRFFGVMRALRTIPCNVVVKEMSRSKKNSTAPKMRVTVSEIYWM
jgi:hypothetical protein